MKYHYVPKCPRCNSYKTGSFIYVNTNYDYHRIVAKYMMKGELVRIRNSTFDSKGPNLYCEECGAEWYGNIITKKINLEEFQEESERRGITPENISENLSKKSVSKNNYKKEQSQKRKKKIKNFFTS